MMHSSAIKIGSRTYSIASVDDSTFDAIINKHIASVDEAKSFVDYDDQIIIVRAKLCNDHKRELLLHEILHACIEDSGVHDEAIERFISILSPRLVSLLETLPVILNEAI